MNELNVAHLTFIQGVINRMANNSFLIKGWSTTVLTALIAVGAALKSELFCLLALLPTVVFWWLDAYFFMLEKVYRDLYDLALQMDSNSKDLLKLNPELVSTKQSRENIQERASYLKERAVYPVYILQIIVSITSAVIIYSCL